MLKVVTANRASGLIYNYLTGQTQKTGLWLLPSLSCYSLPLIFIKASIQIAYYDFQEDHNEEFFLNLIKAKEQQVAGILLVNDYGKNHDYEPLIENLKNQSSIQVIWDKCLSFPELTLPQPSHADLYVYSTGYGKCVNLGYGGYGWIASSMQLNSTLISYDERDMVKVDCVWKKSLASGVLFTDTDLHWIDNGTNLIADSGKYFEDIFLKMEATLQHKKELNTIYNSIIPDELKMGNDWNNWRYNLLVDKPERVIDALSQKKLFASRHYSCLSKVLKGVPLPYSDRIGKHILNLFNDKYYTVQQAQQTAEIVLNLFNEKQINRLN